MEDRKDICEGYERDSVQQLDKLAKDKNERFPIYPLTYIQAVYDARTKERLDSILWKCNNVYLPWMGSAGDTRIQLPFWMRRKGIIITYKNLDEETITEKLTYDLCIADDFFRLDSSWTRITDALPVGGNITIGSNGNWFQDGVDTGFKAQGPKGDNGLTPMLRTVNNKLRYSYDGEVWYEISEYIAAWFRYQDNKIQISRDQKTWSDLSKPFTQDLYIKGYVATSSDLPSTGVKQGDIYMVGPTYAAEDTEHKNPIYRMYVYNDSGWVDNGVFQSIAAGVVQTIGNSETEVMSQKAVSSIVGLDTYPVFSDTKPYVKGEIVNYGGLLYEFTADHEAGAWIGTDARETSLRGEVTGKFEKEDKRNYYQNVFLTFKKEVKTLGSLTATYPNPIKNWASYVLSENKVYAYNGSAWEDTTLTSFTRNTIYEGVSPVIQRTIGKNLLNKNDFLYGYRYTEEEGITPHPDGILSNKLYLSPGSYVKSNITPYESNTHTNVILFNSKDEIVGNVTAPKNAPFEIQCTSRFYSVAYCRILLQYNLVNPLDPNSAQLEKGDTVTDYEEPIIQIYDNPAYGKNKMAFLIGDSIAVESSGWFQNACHKAGYEGINVAISGGNIMYDADRIWRGTLYTEQELEDMDTLVICHTHNYDITIPDNLKDTVADYEAGLSPTNPDHQVVPVTPGSANGTTDGVAANYATAYDYLIKKHMDDCYKLRLKANSKYYGTKCGKLPKIIICSYWQDAYTVFNESSRLIAKKFNITYCDFANNTGFSYRQTNPDDPDSIRISALYCNNSVYGGTNDTHDIPIDGVTYTNMGWHPTRDVNSRLSKQMGDILSKFLLDKSSGKIIDDQQIFERLDDLSKELYDVDGYIHLIVDKNNKIVGGIKKDGSVVFQQGGFSEELTKGIGDVPGILKVVTDEGGNVVMAIREDGVYIPQLHSDNIERDIDGNELMARAIAATINKGEFYSPSVSESVFVNKGSWRKDGSPDFQKQAIFCVHDDDTIDMNIPSSKANPWMTGGGYLSTMYPLLQSVGGIKGCLAMEGQRCGFTDDVPALNDNGKIAKKMQDELGWEIMAHSMTARYEFENYLVESLDSDLANTILANSSYYGANSNNTTSVYVSSENKNYMVSQDKQWVEVPIQYIKPYVKDYNTKLVVMYNPTFPVDYQWGKWLELATGFGLKVNTWVTPASTSSFANVPLINRYFKYGGFGNIDISEVNVPPLTSTIVRLPMENQPGYKGETDTDNSYKPELLAAWKSIVDEAVEKGGWVIFAYHAYRPCWLNKLPGSLVSEGGTYPDSWVYPLRDLTTYPDTYLDPPVEKGINKWSDWHPCPNTRLYMLYEILQYAKQKGMINATSSEAFQKIGNTMTIGYFTKGGQLGFDKYLASSASDYSHFVVGVDGSQDYFNN